jgi:hypothetical protein
MSLSQGLFSAADPEASRDDVVTVSRAAQEWPRTSNQRGWSLAERGPAPLDHARPTRFRRSIAVRTALTQLHPKDRRRLYTRR